MSILSDLRMPIIAAPMAGGPSTPALVRTLIDAGGFGFLAAGYLTASKLEEQMRAAGSTYGVNLFYPQTPVSDLSAVDAYAARLAPVFAELGVEIPDYSCVDSSDGFDAKMDVVCALAPAVVSCTFGLFTAQEVDRLHAAGSEVWMTVASLEDADEAVRRGADALIVQGPEAGGHRATRTVEETPDERPLLELLRELDVNVPVVAAGGLSTPEAVRAALDSGAVAAACGTAFLLSKEAGTSALHREAVKAASETANTRAFSGRVARGVDTQFMRDNRDAPAVYPHVNTLTKPIRSVTSDTNYVSAWAGTQVKHIREGGAADIARWLAGEN